MAKICNKCGIEKELDFFAKGSKYADGRRGTCKKCHAEYSTQYYKDNPKKVANRPQYRRHRLTKEAYQKLLNLYDKKCHVCRDNKAVSIDHDHSCCLSKFSCGKCVRGILCTQCNTALGLLKEDVTRINNLIEYIT